MSATGYTPWVVTVGEQPTTAYWNLLGSNDASFNSGQGFNDQIILWRHLSNDIIPTGVILMWSGSSAPSTQWLVADGSAVSRSTYGALFSICGTAYGTGDGSTTFNLPALAGKVPVGLSPGDPDFAVVGQTGGEKKHTLSFSEMPQHNHPVFDPGHGHSMTTFQPHFPNTSAFYVNDFSGDAIASLDNALGGNNGDWYYGRFGVNGSGTGISLGLQGDNQPHNNIQPYVTVNYIIKT